jgi:hypothetical protein
MERRRAGRGDATRRRTELLLTSDMELSLRRRAARHDAPARDERLLRVTGGTDPAGRAAPRGAERLDSTEDFWRKWLRDGDFPDHPWRIHLQRSALVLKGLTYAPTGAILAAPTTSLPETPGGERNWDYRFSWIRDSTFSLWALHTLGFDQEARDFMRFIVSVCREDPNLQIMYGIGGEKSWRRAPSTTSAATAAPARCDRQRRLRPAPERRLGGAARLDLPARKSAARIGTPADRKLIREQVEAGDRRPGPIRTGDLGGARRAAALRLLEADDLGRRRPRRPAGPQRRLRRGCREWEQTAERIRAEILEHGVRDGSSASTTRPMRSTPRPC